MRKVSFPRPDRPDAVDAVVSVGLEVDPVDPGLLLAVVVEVVHVEDVVALAGDGRHRLLAAARQVEAPRHLELAHEGVRLVGPALGLLVAAAVPDGAAARPLVAPVRDADVRAAAAVREAGVVGRRLPLPEDVERAQAALVVHEDLLVGAVGDVDAHHLLVERVEVVQPVE